MFSAIKERLGKRLLSYMERNLSLGGKDILIKLVSQAIPTYIMSVFRLHDGVSDDLECIVLHPTVELTIQCVAKGKGPWETSY